MMVQSEIEPPFSGASGWGNLFTQGRLSLIVLILLGDWMVAADSLVMATILPSVGRSLAGFGWFGWATSSFLIATVVAGASAGWLAERWGLRAGMMLAGLVFAFGCASSAVAHDIGWFLVGRVLQGCASGWVVGLLYVAMSMLFPHRHLPRLFALLTSVWGVATLVGPLLGGLFADAGLWRWVFWLFAAQALVFAAATAFLVPADLVLAKAPDIPIRSLGLLAVGIFAVVSGGLVPTVSSVLLGAAGTSLLVVAVLEDRRAPQGLLPKAIADRSSPLAAAYLAYFSTSAAGVAFALYAPTILQFKAGLSALEAGYVVAVEALAWTAAALAVSGAHDRWRRRFIVIGASLILLGVLPLPIIMHASNLAHVIAAGAALGAGFGMSYSFISQKVIASLGSTDRARGSSAIGAVRSAGSAVGAALASIGANASGFAQGLNAGNLVAISYATFAICIPFAIVGLLAAIRVAHAHTMLETTAVSTVPKSDS